MSYRVRLESHGGKVKATVEYGPPPDGAFTITGHDTGNPTDSANTLHLLLERPDGTSLVAKSSPDLVAAPAVSTAGTAAGPGPGEGGEQVYGQRPRPAAPPPPAPSEAGQ